MTRSRGESLLLTMQPWWRVAGACVLTGVLLAGPFGAAAQQAPLVVGLAVPMTGPEAGLGVVTLQAFRAAVADANNTGGVHGRPLELVVLDCGPGEPPGLARLIEERRPLAIFDQSCRSQTALLARYAGEHTVMVLATSHVDGVPTSADLFYNSDLQTPAAVGIIRYATQERHANSLGILIDSRTPPSLARNSIVGWATVGKARVTAVDEVPFTPSPVTSVALEQSRKGADVALIIGGVSAAAAVALQAYSKAARSLKVLGWVGPITVEESVKALPGLPEDVIFPLYYRISPQLADTLRRTGLPANGPSLYEFEVASMWVAAARAATETTSLSVAREFDQLRYSGLSGHLV